MPSKFMLCLLFFFIFRGGVYWFPASSVSQSARQKENKRCWGALAVNQLRSFDYLLSITVVFCLCELSLCQRNSLLVKDCAEAAEEEAAAAAAAPHQTSKLSPNTALVSLPPLLHTLLNTSAKTPNALRPGFVHPLPLFWSHLSSKALRRPGCSVEFVKSMMQ